MNENTLTIKKFAEKSSAFVLANTMIEMAYESIKSTYAKSSPKRIEFKVLRERLKEQLRIQYHKNYTYDSIYLTFSPFDETEIYWVINCFTDYLTEHGLDNIEEYKALKDDLIEQTK
jgi:hypothetical protein